MIRVTYIYHDCFIVETTTALLVFDYWKNPLASTLPTHTLLQPAIEGKPLYVFVSHHHKDHFNKEIFEWGEWVQSVRYVMSADTYALCRHIFNPDSAYKGTKVKPMRLTLLRPGENFSDGVINVDAFGSTDIGNSYVVTADGFSIMHAGDLNAWIWKDDSLPEEVAEQTDKFLAIAEDIKKVYPSLDYCMFPVDARIGTDYFTGARLLCRMIDISHFFPMHFELADTPEEKIRYRLAASDFALYANPSGGEYIALQHCGDRFAQSAHNPLTT